MRNALIILITLLVLLLLISAFGGAIRWQRKPMMAEYMTQPLDLTAAHASHEGYEKFEKYDAPDPVMQPPSKQQSLAPPPPPQQPATPMQLPQVPAREEDDPIAGGAPVEPFHQGGEFAVFSSPSE